MAWRLAYGLAQLRKQLNAAAPNRNKRSDGTIGDLAHQRQGSSSEHNPNSAGVVRAMDITHDPRGGVDGKKLAADIIAELDRRGHGGYVIHDGLIRSTYVLRGVWRKYSGSNPHTSHVHVSYTSGYDDRRTWSLPSLEQTTVISLGGGMTGPIGGAVLARVPTTKAPAWPLPSKHLIYHNPRKRSTWHDGFGNDTTGRAAIRQWQQRMKDRGWTITVDGYFGNATEKVVRAFQREKGLGVDGIIGPATWRAAFESPVT